MSTDRELIKKWGDTALIADEFGKASLACVYTILQILRSIDVRHVSPEHAYVHARLYKNAPIEANDTDREMRNTYMSQYREEITEDIAKCALEVIMDLSSVILDTTKLGRQTVGLTKPLYDQIKRTNWTFREYALNHDHDSMRLSLRLVDLAEPEQYVRADMFTMSEVIEMFRPALLEFTRPVRDRNDLMQRTTKIALSYTTTILAIVYGMFNHLTKPYDEYIVDHVSAGECSSGCGRSRRNIKNLERYPIRTPEGAFVFDPRVVKCSQSIERPVEILGDVDLFLIGMTTQHEYD